MCSRTRTCRIATTEHARWLALQRARASRRRRVTPGDMGKSNPFSSAAAVKVKTKSGGGGVSKHGKVAKGGGRGGGGRGGGRGGGKPGGGATATPLIGAAPSLGQRSYAAGAGATSIAKASAGTVGWCKPLPRLESTTRVSSFDCEKG